MKTSPYIVQKEVPDPMVHVGRFTLRCDSCGERFSALSRRQRVCAGCAKGKIEQRPRPSAT